MERPSTRAFGAPFRYIQGPGVLSRLPELLRPDLTRTLVLIDQFLFDELEAKLGKAFMGTGKEAICEKFRGETTEAEVTRVASLANERKCQAICGLGGGKTLDAAKLAGASLGLTVIVAPTSASTDAPTSSMGVLYTPDGLHLRCQTIDRPMELVLVDSLIIAKAPVRLFVAGIGDALSTWYEAEANEASGSLNYIGRGHGRCLGGLALARQCHQVLSLRALEATTDLVQGRLTGAVEDVIEANILLSGLGFENNGCAAAHSLHTGLHEIEGCSRLFHGELVAFGVVFQLAMENRPAEEIGDVLGLMAGVGLPVSLADLGLEVDDAGLGRIVGRVVDGNSGIEAEPFTVTPEAVRSALLRADRLGRDFRRQRPNLPIPWCLRLDR